MASILLVGAFGQGNAGDEALCAAVCRSLADHDVTIASSAPGLSESLHGRRAVPATRAASAAALRRADAVVVGGGTVFKSLHPASGRNRHALLVNTLGLLALARLHHVPTVFVGVGAGELRGAVARTLTQWIVPRADLVVLRDEESAAVLADCGVAPPFWIGADPAWHLFADHHHPGAVPADRAASGGRVTVAVSHLGDAGSDGTAQVTRLGNALAGLAAGGWSVTLEPWQHGGADRRIAERLREHVPDAAVAPPPRDLVAAADTYATEADLVIAMRFHALLAAGAARTRVVAIAHEPKLLGLARRLDQIAIPADASAAVISAAIGWAIEHPRPTHAAVEREVVLAERTLRLMRLVVERGELEHPEELPSLHLSDGEGRW